MIIWFESHVHFLPMSGPTSRGVGLAAFLSLCSSLCYSKNYFQEVYIITVLFAFAIMPSRAVLRSRAADVSRVAQQDMPFTNVSPILSSSPQQIYHCLWLSITPFHVVIVTHTVAHRSTVP